MELFKKDLIKRNFMFKNVGNMQRSYPACTYLIKYFKQNLMVQIKVEFRYAVVLCNHPHIVDRNRRNEDNMIPNTL